MKEGDSRFGDPTQKFENPKATNISLDMDKTKNFLVATGIEKITVPGSTKEFTEVWYPLVAIRMILLSIPSIDDIKEISEDDSETQMHHI